MADVKTRSAVASDLDAIHHLECDSFPAPWRREFFESELHASSRFSLVATRGGHLIGYVFAMWYFEEMHVNKIAVATSERRRGIARLLMERCLDFARELDIATISLEVRESNQVAQDFYRSLDFKPAYFRPKYYPDGESAVVMSKRLALE
jgi:ribosomal-protein-alanine N-acetyltransferase